MAFVWVVEDDDGGDHWWIVVMEVDLTWQLAYPFDLMTSEVVDFYHNIEIVVWQLPDQWLVTVGDDVMEAFLHQVLLALVCLYHQVSRSLLVGVVVGVAWMDQGKCHWAVYWTLVVDDKRGLLQKVMKYVETLELIMA